MPDNRSSGVTLYSHPEALDSHRVRFVLCEKGIEFTEVDPRIDRAAQGALQDGNPEVVLPCLSDQALLLYYPRVIVEYLDDRYPHPPLMPAEPVPRARSRLALHRMELEWFEQLPSDDMDAQERERRRKSLTSSLRAASPVFDSLPFFLSESFSMLDAALAPLLWRMQACGIVLSETAAPVDAYARRLFARPGFQASLAPQDKHEAGA